MNNNDAPVICDMFTPFMHAALLSRTHILSYFTLFISGIFSPVYFARPYLSAAYFILETFRTVCYCNDDLLIGAMLYNHVCAREETFVWKKFSYISDMPSLYDSK